MTPDDPRHGTEAGLMAHRRDTETPCEPCAHARMIAAKRRRLYGPSKVSALGSQRRVQALQALGWSRLVIARRLGYTCNGSMSYLMQAETMLPETAARIAAVFDELCMTIPVGAGPTRARTWAKRLGFVPPLAWDNIDDPDEIPNASPQNADWEQEVDEAMVLRVVNEGGRRPRRLTPAEAKECVRILIARGHNSTVIDEVYGLQANRYYRIERAA